MRLPTFESTKSTHRCGSVNVSVSVLFIAVFPYFKRILTSFNAVGICFNGYLPFHIRLPKRSDAPIKTQGMTGASFIARKRRFQEKKPYGSRTTQDAAVLRPVPL
jgi:hypothetical protein